MVNLVLALVLGAGPGVQGIPVYMADGTVRYASAPATFCFGQVGWFDVQLQRNVTVPLSAISFERTRQVHEAARAGRPLPSAVNPEARAHASASQPPVATPAQPVRLPIYFADGTVRYASAPASFVLGKAIWLDSDLQQTVSVPVSAVDLDRTRPVHDAARVALGTLPGGFSFVGSGSPGSVQPVSPYPSLSAEEPKEEKEVHVKSYIRKDGTKVRDHTRSKPKK